MITWNAEPKPEREAPWVKDLSRADKKELCDIAEKAWNAISRSAREAHFRWRGRPLIASHTTFRLLIHNAAGERVVCRWD
jgi:hypothetical protein